MTKATHLPPPLAPAGRSPDSSSGDAAPAPGNDAATGRPPCPARVDRSLSHSSGGAASASGNKPSSLRPLRPAHAGRSSSPSFGCGAGMVSNAAVSGFAGSGHPDPRTCSGGPAGSGCVLVSPGHQAPFAMPAGHSWNLPAMWPAGGGYAHVQVPPHPFPWNIQQNPSTHSSSASGSDVSGGSSAECSGGGQQTSSSHPPMCFPLLPLDRPQMLMQPLTLPAVGSMNLLAGSNPFNSHGFSFQSLMQQFSAAPFGACPQWIAANSPHASTTSTNASASGVERTSPPGSKSCSSQSTSAHSPSHLPGPSDRLHPRGGCNDVQSPSGAKGDGSGSGECSCEGSAPEYSADEESVADEEEMVEPEEFYLNEEDNGGGDQNDERGYSSGREEEEEPEDEGPAVKYEIVATDLGDCGCSGNPSSTRKRKRWPKGQVLPDCRQPRAMGTIEKAMRNSTNRKTTHIFEPVLGMVFDSRAEAYQFYNLYSWEVGFGIRFGTSSRNRVNKYRTMQELVCEKEGFDPRCTSSSNRDRCKAMLRLHRSQDHGWYVSQHVSEHNHPLSVSCGEKREWNSHSKIEQCTKDMIRYLRENNVTLARVHCILGSMFGSMEGVPFNQKTIRAVCAEIAKDQRNDDWAKTLEIFRQMRAEDPGFQFSVDLDDEGKVRTLIWTSGKSRSQWNYFGDAVTFDTTYCTNIYKMPFGMFVGVNNHFQSIMFAGVLMKEETAKCFTWVFKEFLELMGGKAPATILTDQCQGMTKAIKEVMPDTKHLWCKWHVLRYAPEELGPVYRVNRPFRDEFHYVINEMLTKDEFERAWDDLVERYDLRDHPFMLKTYNKREKWAKPWAKETFCARMANTQRSESCNSILKKFVFRAKRVYAIEKHAMSVYTKKVFEMFREQVDKSVHYNVIRGEASNVYNVVHVNAEKRKGWARVEFTVTVSNDGQKYTCECGMYEHFGILCCHCIKVLIYLCIPEIPKAHIMKHWTRGARDVTVSGFTDAITDNRSLLPIQLRQSLLYVNALEVVRLGEADSETYEIVCRYLAGAKKKIERLLDERMKDKGYCSSAAEGDDIGSDAENHNIYGVGGSSAAFSDAELHNIRLPEQQKQQHRPRSNRFRCLFDKRRKIRSRRNHGVDDDNIDSSPDFPAKKKQSQAALKKVVKPKKAPTNVQETAPQPAAKSKVDGVSKPASKAKNVSPAVAAKVIFEGAKKAPVKAKNSLEGADNKKEHCGDKPATKGKAAASTIRVRSKKVAVKVSKGSKQQAGNAKEYVPDADIE